MAAIFIFETRPSYNQASFPSHVIIFCTNAMMLAAICEDLEHLYDSQTIDQINIPSTSQLISLVYLLTNF